VKGISDPAFHIINKKTLEFSGIKGLSSLKWYLQKTGHQIID
jgi:hypothetical protein